jgi:tripartite-type tricarboxylate transporter receptor subunit TctC
MRKTMLQLIKKIHRKNNLRLALRVLPWVLVPHIGQAQTPNEYPSKPIKFIVPYLPGGLGDSFARAVGQGLSERLAQPVIIENMPGASQAIGAEATAKANADGYTIFMGTQSGLIFNTIYRKTLPYDVIKDFAPISLLFTSPLFLVAHPTVEANSLKELISAAKSHPNQFTIATIGEGTSTSLAVMMLETKAKIKLTQVPYKGSATAITDVISGNVNLMFEGGASSLPFVKQGKLKALATTAEKRNEGAAPGVATSSETVPGFTLETWFGMVAPTGVPAPIVDKLNQQVKLILQTTKIKELAGTYAADITYSTPEQFGRRIAGDLKEFSTVMKDSGVKPQ